MTTQRTDTLTLIAAMRKLASDIESCDGVANASILEAADRLEYFFSLLTTVSIRCDSDGWRNWIRSEVNEAIK